MDIFRSATTIHCMRTSKTHWVTLSNRFFKLSRQLINWPSTLQTQSIYRMIISRHNFCYRLKNFQLQSACSCSSRTQTRSYFQICNDYPLHAKIEDSLSNRFFKLPRQWMNWPPTLQNHSIHRMMISWHNIYYTLDCFHMRAKVRNLNDHSNCAIWIIIRMMVFWTVCIYNVHCDA